MIELVAKLLSGSVYLGGETVECCIVFNHIIQPEHKNSQSHSDILENLAWASAQIHCLYSTTKGGSEKRIHKDEGTSLELNAGEVGEVVIQTKPKILFCDLSIPLGESKKFYYKETLPIEAPPSYRGIGVKYSYKVIIATQKVNSKIKMIRIPIRVFPITPIINLQDVSLLYNNETSEDLLPANPFLDEEKVEESPVTVALQVLQNLTARRCPNSYMITNAQGKVARFCIFKSAYKLGEDIVGSFDFSIGTVVCMQVSVSLQPQEILKTVNKSLPESKRAISVATHHEMTAGLLQSQLILPIPLHITPAFESDKVELKWRLHFEFVTTRESFAKEGDTWSAPLNVPIETMVWNLPIKIYPTLPKHIAQHSTVTEASRLIIN